MLFRALFFCTESELFRREGLVAHRVLVVELLVLRSIAGGLG